MLLEPFPLRGGAPTHRRGSLKDGRASRALGSGYLPAGEPHSLTVATHGRSVMVIILRPVKRSRRIRITGAQACGQNSPHVAQTWRGAGIMAGTP